MGSSLLESSAVQRVQHGATRCDSCTRGGAVQQGVYRETPVAPHHRTPVNGCHTGAKTKKGGRDDMHGVQI